MRILHFANVIGERKGGGIHEVVANLYRYQKELNHEPHIWFPGSDIDSLSIKLDNNIKALATFGNSNYGLIKDLFNTKKCIEQNFDIMHQHGLWMPISIYAKKIKDNFKIKNVIQPHGLLLPYNRSESGLKKKCAYLLYEKSNLKSANALVACALDEAYKLKELFPVKDIAIVPNGVPLDFFNSPFLNLKNTDKKKRLLFLSQIIPVKGLERVLKVIYEIGREKFKYWEFIIAGYEDPNHKKHLINQINELKLNDFVTFVGPKMGNEKVEIFDSATVFILPSFNENYGIVVAEALARKIPVLTTKGTPWEELNTHNCGFWVDNNEEGIKNGLLKVLECSEIELKEMGVRGRNLIEDKYLWSKATLKTIELYNWVLGGGSKPEFVI